MIGYLFIEKVSCTKLTYEKLNRVILVGDLVPHRSARYRKMDKLF